MFWTGILIGPREPGIVKNMSKNFKCTKCGKCCKWEGYVYLEDEDIERLAKKLLGGDVDEFLSKYTKNTDSDLRVLVDKDNSSDCVFLEDNKCRVYEDRPKQCKKYPLKYDSRCPGFYDRREAESMSFDLDKKVKEMNSKLSSLGDFERAVSNNLYENLKKEASSLEVTAKALEGGVSSFFDDHRIKVASMEDLFAFNRVDSNHLIHKATRDLWAIEADEEGDVHITRLFDSGKPIKG